MPRANDHERLTRLLGGAALAALRARLRRRFARASEAPHITLARLSTEERSALEGLLGRRNRTAESLRVAVAELDDAVRRADLASSFRHALELLDGPIPDLGAERVAREAAWARAFAGATHPLLHALIERASVRGLVRRLAGSQPEQASALIESATLVLERLPADGKPRSRLAAEALGDAHALDRGRPVATLVLSALRADVEERDRDIWARVGILVNELSAPALVLNLPAELNTKAGRLAESARDLGEPLHLSLRSLLRESPRWRVRNCDVYVCENTNITAIAADALGQRSAPLICTDGMPSASQQVLLRQLQAQEARLHYHGDFDWPGIQIANFVLRSFDALPWRLSAADYVVERGKALRGEVVEASWDEQLAPRMTAAGVVLEEEAVVEGLVVDLARG
jgi:uncharacterized protein (TIGR02679 family)